METQISSWLCNSSHFDRLVSLGATYYSPDNPALSKDFLNWLYVENPQGPATLIVAHEDELWIGLIALIPLMLVCNGKLQRACFAVNVLTHPDHRTKNLFVKMIKHTREHLAAQDIWLLGHPNANATPAWKRQKMNFRSPLHLWLAKFRLPFSGIKVHPITHIGQLKALPTALWEKLADKSGVHVNYSPEFLEWRFLKAPHREYSVSAIEYRGEIIGLQVTRHFRWMIHLMVDFMAIDALLPMVLSSVCKPTLVLHSGMGSAQHEVPRGCWRLPVKREFPFFVTSWEQSSDSDDMTGITLAASDF